MLLEVQEGQAVVDGGVGAPGQHELDRFVEAVGADQFGPRLGGQRAEVAGQRLRRLLALEIGEALDVLVVGTDDQHRLGDDIGLGEVVFLLALVGDADLVDDGVVAVGVETGDQAVPLALDELRLDAQLCGHRLADLDVEADQLAALVVVGEGRVGAFGADAQHAGRLDGGEVVGGHGGTGKRQMDSGGSRPESNRFHRLKAPDVRKIIPIAYPRINPAGGMGRKWAKFRGDVEFFSKGDRGETTIVALRAAPAGDRRANPAPDGSPAPSACDMSTGHFRYRGGISAIADAGDRFGGDPSNVAEQSSRRRGFPVEADVRRR
ncbi:hypothetical protein KL86PLE_30446 [uncultured Pleomorphomonas sp.]|uniref:Uncharacterized protein n=1 Tax=uncultured Pleomorphomonas sp. TaxID=442121 RepID=A0A212LF36_9HYPH|nr:hypothetical protein KL86PLE_30446 [uncultured Pleomorphomonas sp.]